MLLAHSRFLSLSSVVISHFSFFRPRQRASVWICVLALVCSIFLGQGVAEAQTAEFTQNSKTSNALSIEVPLGNYPGRGLSMPVNLRYSSAGLWRVGFINSVQVNVWGFNIHRSVAEAIYSEHSTAGWNTSLDVPEIEWPKLNDRYWADGKPYAKGMVSPYTQRVARLFVHMPDGSAHEFRKADPVYQDTNTIDMTGTFYAVDNSRMRYDSTGETTGTLYLPDGTRWIFNGTTVQCIDRNGNTLNYNIATRQWTDTLGRVISMPWPANPGPADYNYSLPGVNGSSINYTLKFRNLSDALLSGSPALVPMGDYYLPNPSAPPTSQGGSNFPQATGTSPTMFYSDCSDGTCENQSTYTYVVGRGQSGASAFNPVVLSEIVLPNGQSYRFWYNNFGELAKAIYPTGGYQRYSYSQVPTMGGAQVPFDQGSRGMTSRWVSPNGTGTDEAQWTYSTTGSVITVTEPDSTGAPNGVRYQTYLHTFNANNNFGYTDARHGLPYEERIYAPQSQGGAMLRRTLINYQQSSATYNKPHPQYPGTYIAYRNARPVRNVSLILDTGSDALSSTTTTSYDTTYQFTVGLDATAISEYAFAVVTQTTAQTAAIGSIPFGTLVKTTQSSFLTSNANYRNRNILGLATSVTILNALSQIVAQSSIAYDEASYPLITIGSVTSWNDPLTSYRGNLTSTSRWLDYPTPSWISTHSQYDQCGSVRYNWDARGNQTSIFYSSSYAYAYPTQTTSAVPDPDGSHGSAVALVATSVYDFNTGLLTSATDANNQVTTFEYNDPSNRPTKVNRPDGGWTMTDYSDTPGNTYVHTQTLQRSTPSQQTIETYQFVDKLGRQSRSFAKENTTYLTTDTQYDNLGRVWRVSNVYRTNTLTDAVNPSGNWTTSSYDLLGRLTLVTSPDGAQVSSVYSAVTTGTYIGPSVTVTDAAVKSRKSINDALGRVIQVIEDPNGLAYQTNYTYDVLSNLRKVEQGAQSRYFGYDSLSRLIRVRQVEQSVNSALTWADPVTGYNGWTAGMSYDAAGNITSRVDARNITTTLTYDGLNRPTITLYRINGQPDPNTGDVENLYDNAAQNGKGRLWLTFKWGSQPFQTAVGTYDAAGRITQMYRLFGNGQGGWYPAYAINATYDFTGKMLTQSYPSGRTVTYGYDGAGRMNSFAGNLGDGTQRTYSTGVSYSPYGMEQEQFGTQTPLYHKLHYNVRGQLYDVRVSTQSLQANEFEWNRGCLAFYYGGAGWGLSSSANNGSVTTQQHWAPADDAISNYGYTQDTYVYDSLNRLSSTTEVHGGPGGQSGTDYVQAYTYDRYGNRTINLAQTTTNISRPAYTVDANTNRLIAPAGFTYGYDAAGNQDNDTYTGQGPRTFDAENHMKQAWASNQWQTYTYDGDGKRVIRQVNGVTTWQIYGIGEELLAEYALAAAPASPQKEYGYRNGQLLISTTGAGGGSPTSQNVVWTNTAGVSVSGNSLTKNVATAWGNSGASSTQSITSGDGYVEFTPSTLGTLRAIGLSKGDSNQTQTDIDFAIVLGYSFGHTYRVWENGVEKFVGPTYYAATDVFRVAVEGGVVKYYRNGTLFYTSTTAPTYPLLVDTAFYTNGATINNVVLTTTPASSIDMRWLVNDNLGTPRMSFDQSGSLAGTRRHDYLPFGEEISAGTGGRTTGQGYTADGIRQHFTGYELDAETGLNFAQARYQSPVQGRFTSVDPLGESANVTDPQSMNRYSYVLNNPINMIDPDGMMGMMPDASMNWETVSNAWANALNFGGPETGRTIIAAAEARFDRGVADVMQAKALNDAVRQGKITPAEAEAIVKTNENLAIENTGSATASTETRAGAGAPETPEPQKQQQTAKPKPKKGSKQKLTYSTISGGAKSASWSVKWKLAKPSKSGGWIVQEITAVDQNGNQIAHFWEAWQVPANSKVTTYDGISSYDDVFQAPSGTKASATARFYEGLQLPAAFTPGGHPYSGILPSTTGNPNLPTNNATAPVNRRWRAP